MLDTNELAMLMEQVANNPNLELVITSEGARIAQKPSPSVGAEIAGEKLPKPRKAKRLPKVLTRKEVAKIFHAINTKTRTGLRNYVAFLLMYRCGLRVSEVCRLSLKDVNFETGLLFVQISKGKRDRYISMDDETMAWCKKWLSVRPEKADRFLCAIKGTALMPRYLNTTLERLSQKTGVFIQDGDELKTVHCHVFRHCYATELIEEGYSIIEVKHLLGHSSIQTTQVYSHCREIELGAKIRARKSIL